MNSRQKTLVHTLPPSPRILSWTIQHSVDNSSIFSNAVTMEKIKVFITLMSFPISDYYGKYTFKHFAADREWF